MMRPGSAEPTPRTTDLIMSVHCSSPLDGSRGGAGRICGLPGMEAVEIGFDLVDQAVADHVVAEIDGGRKAISSVPPWLLTTMPLRPRKTPPLTLRGSIFSRRRSKAPWAKHIADLGHQACGSSRRADSSPIWRAVPSAVFSAMLPAKPSVTTTSTVPLPMSSPSTKP